MTTNQIHSLNYILMKNIKSQSVVIFSDNHGVAVYTRKILGAYIEIVIYV